MIKNAKSVGRLELLSWINNLCECDYPRVETCCDGIGYAQVLDAMAPSQPFPLHKLNFNAKSKEERIANLKLFQAHLKKLRLPFVPDCTSIANGRFQNNIEVIMFLYD